MKRVGKILGAILAIVIIPGILTALAIFLIAKAFGLKIDLNKLKSKIWKED